MTPTRLDCRLGWLGTGRMGSALALRLLAAGCEVAVYNRTRARAEPLAAHGATITATAAGLADAEIVFVTVGASQDLLDAVLGPGGLLSGPSAPAIVVDCSTVSAEASEQVRERLAERGSTLLAAPVMGNAKVAAAGRLTLAVSGPEDSFRRARPYLDLLGSGATYVGEGETARIVKLCHNLLLGVVTQTLAEVTILAQQYGVPRRVLLECLNNSVMGSTFSRYKTPALVNLDFRPTFTATLLRKDFDLGLAAAREREVPLPVAGLVHQLIQGLVGRGYGDQDFAALIAMQADSAGVTLASEDVPVSDGLEPGLEPGPAGRETVSPARRD
jgi:3-hydroxyisobutyrate dehydrogenase-like beta-hydroxyacid dehydrogenase